MVFLFDTLVKDTVLKGEELDALPEIVPVVESALHDIDVVIGLHPLRLLLLIIVRLIEQ